MNRASRLRTLSHQRYRMALDNLKAEAFELRRPNWSFCWPLKPPVQSNRTCEIVCLAADESAGFAADAPTVAQLVAPRERK